MKKPLLRSLFIFLSLNLSLFTVSFGQMSCEELIEYVEDKDYGMTYYSYDSDAITQVSFHDFTDENYNTYYFAIVQFTSSFKNYIYQVDYTTETNYSIAHYDSAGKAFWEYIHPHRGNLGCAPEFD